MDDSLRNAVLGAQQLGAPASPLGAYPEIAKLYESSFQAPLSNAATQAGGFNDSTRVEAEKKAAEEAEARRQQALADMQDPSKYQRIPDDAGGYQFLAPDGQKISAHDYARITGKQINEVLRDSQNPVDIGFVQDFDNLNSYINDKLNSKNDKEAYNRAQAIEQAVGRENPGVNLGRMEIKDVLKRFKQAYPTVYGGKNKGVRSGRTFIPTPSDNSSSSMSIGGGVAQFGG